MKAAIIEGYADDIKIVDIETPELHDDSVIIQVHAASLNPIDSIVRAGYLKDMMPVQFPYVMGYDVSGIVTEIGKDVSSVKIGDAVFARPNQSDSGSLAEFARINQDEFALKPDSVSHAEAASLPLAGLTAWQALFDKAQLKGGQKVLIHGGSGGVGSLAIQIAKHIGAYVATTASPRNEALLRELGADINTQAFEDELSDYDVVFDMIGGEVMNRSFTVLKKGGCLVPIKGHHANLSDVSAYGFI